jgi:Putative transposase of IS4/5 family (DUF4096)
MFNGLRYIVKTGAPWRYMPHNLPPWAAVYQQIERWLSAECCVARSVEQHEDHLIIPVRLDAVSGRCPIAGRRARPQPLSPPARRPAGVGIADQAPHRGAAFSCSNPTCRRRTFAEAPMTRLAPRVRRTRRLGEAQARVGIACGGAGGARLLAH